MLDCVQEVGIALQSLQGKIDLIYACVQDLVFHYWANRDLRVAFSTHPDNSVPSMLLQMSRFHSFYGATSLYAFLANGTATAHDTAPRLSFHSS